MLCAALLSWAAASAGAASSARTTTTSQQTGTQNNSNNQNQNSQQQQNATYGGPQGVIYTPPPDPNAPNGYVPPDASGVYHSDRYVPAPFFSTAPMASPMAASFSTATARKAGPPPPATIDDARDSLPTLIANFIARSGKDGVFPLPGASERGKPALVRLEGMDQNAVKDLGSGLFAAPVHVRDASGRAIEAEVTADLSGDEWKVLEISRRNARGARGAGPCFEEAVRARVRAGTRGRKGFVFHDEDLRRDWRLKLERIHAQGLKGFGAGRYYGGVDFKDLDKGRSVDLDFYVTRKAGRCLVDGIVVHAVEGKVRTTKPQPAP